ncbi:hypothetical protein F5J12DRAFT_246611 [Pisolithus orientalis]|uniref:uncharacterized protein n=1 Tax=Pisolithus orientalis TaxID=936130 RepID=UPI00222438DD|nr:uncharacterized protein F5J12DRAFT_246611 [Pisolithus orientalis]KAI6001021.1 hypothetical protein F5J12DRAFT_246611 [Pisolithus orientalis]
MLRVYIMPRVYTMGRIHAVDRIYTMPRRKPCNPSTSIFDKLSQFRRLHRNLATACLQQFSESDYAKFKQSFLFNNLLEQPTLPPLDGTSLHSGVQSKIRSYVFANVPLRVIKLPEMTLMGRSAAADYLVKTKLENVVRAVAQQEQAARRNHY